MANPGDAGRIHLGVVPAQKRLDIDCVGISLVIAAEMVLLHRESLQTERVMWLHAPQIGTSVQGENPPKRVVGLPLLVQPNGLRSSRLLQ